MPNTHDFSLEANVYQDLGWGLVLPASAIIVDVSQPDTSGILPVRKCQLTLCTQSYGRDPYPLRIALSSYTYWSEPLSIYIPPGYPTFGDIYQSYRIMVRTYEFPISGRIIFD